MPLIFCLMFGFVGGCNTTPTKEQIAKGDYGGGVTYGYRLAGNVNARNSFGGYVGYRRYLFVFRDGEIVAAWSERELAGGRGYGRHMMRIK